MSFSYMFDPYSLLIFLAGVALGIAYIRSVRRRRKLRHRAQNLRNATFLLTEHYDALERFLSDPASPELARQRLIDLNDIMASEHLSRSFVQLMVDRKQDGSRGKRQAANDDSESIIKVVTQLERHRPDLAEDFHTALAAGVSSMFLRWRGLDKYIVTALPWAAAHRRQDIAVINTVAHYQTVSGRDKTPTPVHA